MSSLVGRARFASLLAAACALLITGVAAGAAGSALILGADNSSGTSQTVLNNAGLGAAFTLRTTNTANGATGIFGWSSNTTASVTRGVYGKADGANAYGVFGRQSGDFGSGAAVYGEGNNNVGVMGTSTGSHGVVGVGDCVGFCAANGVDGTGAGFGAGVFGDGSNSVAGVWAADGFAASIFATQSLEAVPAVWADSTLGTGATLYGQGANESFAACDNFYCAGAVIAGDNGVLASAGLNNGVALYGRDDSPTGGFGLWSEGNAVIEGDLSVSGTCTGCTAAATAINGSNATLNQGDAVALEGVRTAPDGSIVLVVRAAKDGDQVVGIVDRQMSLSGKTVKAPASERKVLDSEKGERIVKTPARELTSQLDKWLTGGTKVGADKYLRIITGGVFAFDGAAPADAAVGDPVAVSESAGKLRKAGADSVKAGKYMGKLKDGRVVLMVQPD